MPEKIFIYGTFRGSSELPMRSGPDIAVEILREFSASELVGKVYVVGRTGGWAPVSQPGIRDYIWYKNFPKDPLKFYTEGSGPWDVLYFRQESDESGPYLAVGLKLRGH
jgi:hypothetical protein